MQENFIKQLTSMQQTLSQNIESIRHLLRASDAMGEIIQSLSKNNDTEAAEQLKKTREEILQSINQLIQQTDSLFATYKNMVESL